MVKGNFQMFSLQWVGGALVDPDILRRVFHSTQVPPAGFNRGHYRSPEVDRADRPGVAGAERGRAAALLRRGQRMVAEDAPYIPIWNRTNVVIAQRSLAGLARGARRGDFQMLRDARPPAGRLDHPLSFSISCRASEAYGEPGAGRRSA